MEVIKGQFGKVAPEGLAANLRRLADAVDLGEVAEFYGMWIEGDRFTTEAACSIQQQIVFASLLHRQAVDRACGIE